LGSDPVSGEDVFPFIFKISRDAYGEGAYSPSPNLTRMSFFKGAFQDLVLFGRERDVSSTRIEPSYLEMKYSNDIVCDDFSL